jgi:hypothetical protein
MLLQGFKLSLQRQQFSLRPFLCFTTSGRGVLPAFRRFTIFVFASIPARIFAISLSVQRVAIPSMASCLFFATSLLNSS